MLNSILTQENSPENSKKVMTRYYNQVFPFYMHQGESRMLQAKKAKISCRLFINPNAKAKIIIVNGYNESYLKYAEVIYDFYLQGYSVYVYDHRGQGFSQKFPDQKNRGFIDSFDNLIEDLEFFFNFVDNSDKKTKIFVIGHSMGGAVTTLAACQNKIAPNRIVLSAPMFGIVLTPFPILEYPVYLISRILCDIGFSHTYAFGQKDCFPLRSFENNQVTHSLARYQIWQAQIRETPEVQLGGPTFQWIRESIHASLVARVSGEKNNIPILLLQAEKDTVVRNDMQDVFIKHCSHSEKKIIKYSKHEIFMEIDPVREEVFQKIADFLACNI